MNTGSSIIEWAGETLTLLPERAVWWPRGKTLLIADPHFGKAATFRFAGIPVPESSHDYDMERLSQILAMTASPRLVILGDFFHAKSGRNDGTLSALAAWRSRHPELEVFLVRGNHDKHAGPLPAEWNFHCVHGPWPLGPFLCRHEPLEDQGAFVLAGHLHPAFRLSDRTGSSIYAPCFFFGARMAVLPAFGSFTGTHRVRPGPNDRIFLIGPDSVIETSRHTS